MMFTDQMESEWGMGRVLDIHVHDGVMLTDMGYGRYMSVYYQ